MTNKKYSIFILDGCTKVLQNLMPHLHKHPYSLSQFTHPNSCLTAITKQHPDLALISIQTGQTNNLSIVQELKTNKKTKQIPIILLSDNDNPEIITTNDRHKTCDIITPNSNLTNIENRIHLAIKNSFAIKELERKIAHEKQNAFNAMQNSSELGLVIQFLERITSCNTYKKVAELIFDFFKKLNVYGSITFHHCHSNYQYFSSDYTQKPIELELIKELKNFSQIQEHTIGNIKSLKKRLLACSQNATLLIRNPPSEDKKREQLTDILNALINGIDSKIIDIERHISAEKTQTILNASLQTTQKTISYLDISLQKSQKETCDIISAVMSKMESRLSMLGLTEAQETYFIELLDHSMQKLVTLYTSEVEIERSFSKVSGLLQKLK